MGEIQTVIDYLEMEKNALENLNVEEIYNVLNKLMETYRSEGTIYICGNGGSASTASHMANDFNKGISEYVDKKFRVCCLNDNTATILSIANDIGYEEIFRFQLIGKLQQNDLVIGISGSGNSANVVNAITYAKEQGISTIAFCGYEGGRLKELADCSFHVKLNNMKIVEDMHLMLNHLLMYAAEEELGIRSVCK